MSSSQPNILLLTQCWPRGRMFGGQLRTLHTARALTRIGSVDVLVVGSEAADSDAARLTAEEFSVLSPAPCGISGPRTAWDRIRRAADINYLNVHGYAVSHADRERILRLLSRYDLVWVSNARTPNLAQIWSWPRTHLDIDDLPSACLRHRAQNWVNRVKHETQRLLLLRRERAYPRRFTTLSVCSDADRKYLGLRNVHVIPNGFMRPATDPVRRLSAQAPRIGFIGLYSYEPNLAGMRWFLRYIWPRVCDAVPGIRLRLVGKDTDGALRPMEPATDALGWIADPADEISTWSAMIVPVRFGGGTRVKLADAFSRKCPVVSTRMGAYGYDVADGWDLRLADDTRSFADACIQLVRDPAQGAVMAERAWQEFLARWTWDAITPRIWAAAEDCLRHAKAPAA